MKTLPWTLATPTRTPPTSNVPQPRPGRSPPRFAGLIIRGSRPTYSFSASNAWLPSVKKSTTDSKAEPLFAVTPRPPGAEFSPLATTTSNSSSRLRAGTSARTAAHPASPTTSPMKSRRNAKYRYSSHSSLPMLRSRCHGLFDPLYPRRVFRSGSTPQSSHTNAASSKALIWTTLREASPTGAGRGTRRRG